MIPAIRKHILAGADKNAFAPYIFIILCVYATIVSVYTSLFFNLHIAVIRIITSIFIVIVYVLLERSALKSDTLAFFSPAVIVALLFAADIYFRGDFLLFAYTTGCAMISLTYMKPKGLAAYIAIVSTAGAFILLVLNINLLGSSFTMIYNYLYFLTSTVMNILVFIFCKSYTQTLSALTEAKNEAYKSSLAKGAFLSSMSHEIRTPMNAIIGMTAIGKATNDIDNAHYALNKIEDASMHLLGIINDVLDMSKIESGKFDLSYVEFSFVEMLRRVINVISFRVDEKKQNFILHIDEKIPSLIIGDDQRLAQIVTNLLGNAVKFTPSEGDIYLNARLLQEEDDLCTIQIEVIDSGIGISQEQQARIFQSFQQAEMSITRRFGGTGLGLSISKNLVELMGGKIWVESELGNGASFSFTFQARRAGLYESGSAADEIFWENTNVLAQNGNNTFLNKPLNCKGKCLLLAEDVDVNREIMIALLEPTNLKIVCAENGTQVVSMFTEAPDMYDMIFMDLQMPEMDGYEATRRIRSLDIPWANAIPIIAMTANAFREDIDKCLEVGMDGHLSKPLELDKVFGILKKYLD